jgi:hypothetical protein
MAKNTTYTAPTFGGAPISTAPPKGIGVRKDTPKKPVKKTVDNSANAGLWESVTGAKTPKTSTYVDGNLDPGKVTTAGPPKPAKQYGPPKPAKQYGPPSPAMKAPKSPKSPPAAAVAVASAVGTSPSTNPTSGGQQQGSSPAPAAPAMPKAPGAVYRKTQASYSKEKSNAGNRFETPEQEQSRKSSSKFDWSMSGDDVKTARAAFLKTHPAAAKAVAKGTLSMGDINMTVRRLKKKNTVTTQAQNAGTSD